jgi:very-short-patch-repair endonuclease
MRHDWNKIQSAYDSGLSERAIVKNFKVSSSTIHKARKSGRFKCRTKSDAHRLRKGVKHSEETKRKISKIRKDYLALNPDKVPYRLNHSSKESYPEKLVRLELENRKMQFKQHHPMWKYEYDFAFLEYKLDVEIDGTTHLSPKVMLIDQERDIWSKNNGWQILRFSAKEVKENVKQVVDYIEDFMYITGCKHL